MDDWTTFEFSVENGEDPFLEISVPRGPELSARPDAILLRWQLKVLSRRTGGQSIYLNARVDRATVRQMAESLGLYVEDRDADS